MGRAAGPVDPAWLVAQALFDIAGKYLQCPATQLLGGRVRDSIPLSHSIPWGSPEEMAAMASEKQAAGFGTVKCKVGQGVEKDAAAVRAVRAAIDRGGKPTKLRVDANSECCAQRRPSWQGGRKAGES